MTNLPGSDSIQGQSGAGGMGHPRGAGLGLHQVKDARPRRQERDPPRTDSRSVAKGR